MKKYLLAGLAFLLPLVLTAWVIIFLLNLFTDPLLDIATYVLAKFPNVYDFLNSYSSVELIARICSLIMTCLFILFLGVIAQMFFINSLLLLGNAILCKIPFVKSIYKLCKDVINACFQSKEEKKAFKRSVMVPFPSEDSQCIGFVSGEVPKACQEKVKTPLVPVFVPTAPYPISGYFMLVPESKINEIDMTKEEALKFTVSCGVITPKRTKDES